MKSTGIVRNVDDLGRIVIPKEMRRKMNIATSDPLEIFVEGDKIILAKYKDACLICGTDEGELNEFKGKKICPACIAELRA